MKRGNPRGRHLTHATAKEQREYEHILESELKSGKSTKRAKSIAAATVRKAQKKRRRNGVTGTIKSAVKKTLRVGTAAIKGAVKGVRGAAKNPTLTDPEIVVLRAMKRINPGAVTMGSLVSIREILKAVNFPKYKTKQILLDLAQKGILALHEHDYPGSLTREERRLMIAIPNKRYQPGRLSGGGKYIYYIGAAIRDPGSLPAIVRNPQINQIVRDYIRAGRTQKAILAHMRSAGFTAKQIAEAKRIYKKELAFVRSLEPKTERRPGVRNKAGQISEADISRLPESAQRQIRAQLGKIEQAESKATTPKQKRIVEKRRRSLLSRVGTRLRFIGQSKRFKVEARNLNKAPLKTVKVRARHESDALAKARAKLGSGYDNFRVKNRSRRRAGNPSVTFTITAKAKGKKRSTRKPNGTISKLRKLREDFTGQPRRKTTTLYASNGTPGRLAKLGTLISIKTPTKTIKPTGRNPHGEIWLCADARGRLHLCSPMARLMDGPARSFGEVMEIEYQTPKPHLGYRKLTDFYHELGEEGGRRPTLHADGAGGLKFKGGDYFITPEGLRD